MKYNTAESQLILPEYGRHIQKMIDHCLEIEDRQERTNCALAIADIIKKLHSGNAQDKDNDAKIWDHIYMMSRFKLDIDFPVEVTREDELNPKPKNIPYPRSLSKFRHYGKSVQEMLRIVADMENNIEKDRLIFLIANQMKKLLVSRNSEIATDIRVFKDIKEITHGKIDIHPDNYRLNDYIGVMEADANKKKRKK